MRGGKLENLANDVVEGSVFVLPEDLHAYVRGELSFSRRSEIEGFLACNPDLAAQVMTGLHTRRQSTAPRKAKGLAIFQRRPLDHRAWRLRRSRRFPGMRREAPNFWPPAKAPRSRPPAYVPEAVMSRRATLLRTAMASQVETPKLDSNEIRRSMRLRLPALPNDWKIVDVQVYPSDDGPSLNLLIKTASGRDMNLFAVRANTAVTRTPLMTTSGGQNVAYWEIDNSAYVLLGDVSREELRGEAAALSKGALLRPASRRVRTAGI